MTFYQKEPPIFFFFFFFFLTVSFPLQLFIYFIYFHSIFLNRENWLGEAEKAAPTLEMHFENIASNMSKFLLKKAQITITLTYYY